MLETTIIQISVKKYALITLKFFPICCLIITDANISQHVRCFGRLTETKMKFTREHI